MLDGGRVLVGADAELWLDGVDLRGSATQIVVGPQTVSVDTTLLQAKITRSQPVLQSGNMQLQLLQDESKVTNVLDAYWLSAIRGEYVAPILWSAQEGLNVGQVCGATMISPQSNPVVAASAQDVVRRSYGGSWHSAEAYGVLRSGQTAAGRNPLGSSLDSDYALADIDTVGPDIYTDTVAVDRGVGSHIGIAAHIKDVVGHPGTQPVLRIPIPEGPNDWRGQYAPPNSHNGTIWIYHKGVGRGAIVAPGDEVQTVLDHIGELRWPDGFQVSVVRQNHQFIITGSHYGADEDIELPAGRNALSQWRGGPVSGTGNETQVRLVSATGSGGSRVYSPLSEFVSCDSHHTPVVLQHFVKDGLEQIGLQFQVPVAGSPYNYQMRYSIGYVRDGDGI